MKFTGFIGPTYNLKSVNVDCQRCINLYPEIIESGTGKEGNILYYKSTPGLQKLFTCGDGPIRGVWIDDPVASPFNPPNRMLVASGNEMFKASFESGAWTATKIGDLQTTEGPMSGVMMPGNLGSGVFVDGVESYQYFKYLDDALISEDFDTFGSFGWPTVPGATQVLWVDGFLIFIVEGSDQFYVSEWNSLEVDPLSFASTEGSLDKMVGGIVLNRQIFFFNERSTEVWANTGNADFPFERIQGGFIEKGCVSASSIAKIDDLVLWLGRDESGQGIVYATQSVNPQRISTHAIEYAISTYADISKASAYTYQSEGHSFYVLSFPEGTWVYDLSTKMWHERAYTNEGALERHRGEVSAFHYAVNLQILGDYETNEVYALNSGVYTDDGDLITRQRISPHISASMSRVFFKRLTLDLETGIGLDGGVQGSDPQVMMQFSNDGGHTWSSEMWAGAGKKVGGIGDFKKRVIWNRLGSSRDRVFKITMTDPVPWTLIGAELDVETGAT